ncbi:FAD-dependent oxidoreductase [Archangium gephyra]|nr:FAD-dependent oxidoreductase [Archangium gephyra]
MAVPDGRAVIIGGGIAGLLAAHLLARRGWTVTLLESDRVPPGTAYRVGIPQSRHIHRLLMRGLAVLEARFPGIGAELEGEGALQLDLARDVATHGARGWLPRFSSGLTSLFCSREMLSAVIHRRALAGGAVTVREGCRVRGLVLADERRRVRGVITDTDGVRLDAELVIDASGRASKLPQWLREAGLTPPRESCVDEQLGYASRYYRPSREAARSWDALYISDVPLALPRSGGIFPIEGGLWHVTLAGYRGDCPPTDAEGFDGFAKSLASPLLYEHLRRATPCSPIYGSRKLLNRWLHYEELDDLPDGLLVMGDALCTFNPVHGQGMTTALLVADRLSDVGPGAGWSRRFMRSVAPLLERPWLLATAGASEKEVESRRPSGSTLRRQLLTLEMQAMGSYLHVPAVYRRYLRIAHLS